MKFGSSVDMRTGWQVWWKGQVKWQVHRQVEGEVRCVQDSGPPDTLSHGVMEGRREI